MGLHRPNDVWDASLFAPELALGMGVRPPSKANQAARLRVAQIAGELQRREHDCLVVHMRLEGDNHGRTCALVTTKRVLIVCVEANMPQCVASFFHDGRILGSSCHAPEVKYTCPDHLLLSRPWDPERRFHLVELRLALEFYGARFCGREARDCIHARTWQA